MDPNSFVNPCSRNLYNAISTYLIFLFGPVTIKFRYNYLEKKINKNSQRTQNLKQKFSAEKKNKEKKKNVFLNFNSQQVHCH